MTIRNFEIFVAVCDCQSMSAAADRLLISQSGVSLAIKEMEKFYNTKLFERHSRKIYITHQGEQLLTFARNIVANCNGADEVMRNAPKTKLRVGSSLNPKMLIELMAEYRDSGGRAEITMYARQLREIELMLRASLLDFAIVEGIVNESEFYFAPLLTHEMVFVAAENSRLHPSLEAPCPSIDLSLLGKLPLFVWDNFALQETLELKMKEQGGGVNIAGYINYYDAIAIAAAKDLGLGLITKALFNEAKCGGAAIKRVCVEGLELSSRIYMMYHRNKHLSDDLRSFRDFAARFVGSYLGQTI